MNPLRLVVFRRHSARQCPGGYSRAAGGAYCGLVLMLLLLHSLELAAQICTDAGFLAADDYTLDTIAGPFSDKKHEDARKAKATLPRLQAFVSHYQQAEVFDGQAGDSIRLTLIAYPNGRASEVYIRHSTTAPVGREAKRLFLLMQDYFQWPLLKHRGRAVATRQDFSLKLLPAGETRLAWLDLPPPPPPPPAPETRCEELFRIVSKMPRLPGCEEVAEEDRLSCTQEKLIAYLQPKQRYPQQALANQKEGLAIVYFVVEKNGSISDIALARDPGYGMGDEALRLVRLLPQNNIRFSPASHRGRPVRVQLQLPLRFRLCRQE